MREISISTEYFKQYRIRLGFTQQGTAGSFLGAKDIIPKVDFSYIDTLNQRLDEIIEKIGAIVPKEIKPRNLKIFKNKHRERAYEIIRKNNILSLLNNQGRRPEQVYFNWMRGYVTQQFFLKSLEFIFEIKANDIAIIGDDTLQTADTFKRAPTADLELSLHNGEHIRVEIQSGFTGINDIKQHKVLEAKRVFENKHIHSLVIHFDLYNGQVAFVKLDTIENADVHWVTRQQMEGQTVFNINQNHFMWKLTELPPTYKDINFE